MADGGVVGAIEFVTADVLAIHIGRGLGEGPEASDFIKGRGLIEGVIRWGDGGVLQLGDKGIKVFLSVVAWAIRLSSVSLMGIYRTPLGSFGRLRFQITRDITAVWVFKEKSDKFISINGSYVQIF